MGKVVFFLRESLMQDFEVWEGAWWAKILSRAGFLRKCIFVFVFTAINVQTHRAQSSFFSHVDRHPLL